MPVTLTDQWIDAANRLQGNASWAWCWGIELDVTESARYLLPVVNRDTPLTLTSFQDPLTPNEEPGDRVHYPMGLRQSEFSENSDGNLPTVSLEVDNPHRVFNRWFEETGGGIVGNRAYAALMLASNPATTQVRTFTITSAIVGVDRVSLQLEMPNTMQLTFPEDRYDARRCGLQFGSVACGYPVNLAAAHTTCGLTIADCRLRGDDEVARNLPRLHPRRFDAFPGVPNQ